MLSAAGASIAPRHDVAADVSVSSPLLDANALFADLEHAPALLLAVSGGPDSMALMALAAEWADTRDGAPAIHVATVDHGLRPAARDEADAVAAAASRLGVSHATLTWCGPKPATRLQELARDARYGLLADHARTLGASHILTAHHADDQAETILLRLGRGSGIGGLAGMRRHSALGPDLTLTRPLLGVTKDDLVAFCRARAIAFAADPSNGDPAYARTRLRQQARMWDALGLDRPALLRLARRMARAEDALDAAADRLERLIDPDRGGGAYRADFTQAADAPTEILLRLLRRAVTHVGGTAARGRLDRLETLTEAIGTALHHGVSHAATLGGALVTVDCSRVIVVRREPPRRRGMKCGTAEAKNHAEGRD